MHLMIWCADQQWLHGPSFENFGLGMGVLYTESTILRCDGRLLSRANRDHSGGSDGVSGRHYQNPVGHSYLDSTRGEEDRHDVAQFQRTARI